MLRRYMAGFLLTGICLTACASAADKPGKALKPPTVRIDGIRARKTSGDYLSIVCTVSNPNSAALPFVGYLGASQGKTRMKAVVSPVYQIAYRQAGKWTSNRLLWCGTGLGAVAIPATQEALFYVTVPASRKLVGGKWEAVRIGITWYEKPDRSRGSEKVVWSKPVKRSTLVGDQP